MHPRLYGDHAGHHNALTYPHLQGHSELRADSLQSGMLLQAADEVVSQDLDGGS